MNEIQLLLDEASATARRIYNMALAFLILGLGVAGAGVVYFYFSNDALFLDRAFYEEQINKLEIEIGKTRKADQILLSAYNKEARNDSLAVTKFNILSGASNKIYRSYEALYNSILKSNQINNEMERLIYIQSRLTQHSAIMKEYESIVKKVNAKTSTYQAKRDDINEIIQSFDIETNKPIKYTKPQNSYDKPELVFSPKLVYGFFSRLGGLIFIELIAFYLLKQYRVNMNDFRYYNSLVRQTRSKLYLMDISSEIQDTNSRIDTLAKLFHAEVSISDNKPSDTEDILNNSEIDGISKLLTAIKELIKK